ETITAQRIERLRTWVTSFEQQQELHASLHQDALQEAELELDRLVRRGDVREGAIDSLGLTGPDLVPSVNRRLRIETADMARERLSSVLYRLVSAPTLAIRLPEVPDALASLDSDPRRQAAKQLADQAKEEDLPLLETLFGHTDPLVREMALRGLQNAGGGDTSRLTKLLEDPDKNVRAAVLKLWLDHPDASLVEPVSNHATRETDSGLLVYYVRLLKELNSNSEQSLAALKTLAGNDDWQVRAEVAEVISHRAQDDSHQTSPFDIESDGPLPSPLRDAARQLLDDEDSFVLSKIVPAVLAVDQKESFAKLLRVAWKHESIRKEILPKLTNATGRKQSAEFLVSLTKSDTPGDRAFALQAMATFSLEDQETHLKNGIDDADPSVRLAAARALVVWLDRYHAQLDVIPSKPANGGVFGSSDIITFEGSIDSSFPELQLELDPPPPSNGLLDILGGLFGNGSTPAAPATPAVAEKEESEPENVLEQFELEAAEYQQTIASAEAVDDPFLPVPTPQLQIREEEGAPGGKVVPEADADTSGDVKPEPQEAVTEKKLSAQQRAAQKYDQWLAGWREAPKSTLPWLAGVREKLEELAQQGGETEAHAMLAALRLGSTLSAEEILELANSVTETSKRLSSLYPWLPAELRLELFEAAGQIDQSGELLPVLLEQSQRYDPEDAEQTYWNSLRSLPTSALDNGYELRRNLMLVTVGQEYIGYSEAEELEPVADQLASRLEQVPETPARLLGLSILGDLAPAKVAELVAEDYQDPAFDDVLRSDWARLAIASRGEDEAVGLAISMLDDDALLPAALAFITQGYEGIQSTATGSVSIPSVETTNFSNGKLVVATIPPGITSEILRPL
ncbi:MAG: hypothetical protein MI861_00775, partial [Pirellulales bacterium]|nr:hypothetical protein [Pirellulales bacterium]